LSTAASMSLTIIATCPMALMTGRFMMSPMSLR
jgi:hypothetical protein